MTKSENRPTHHHHIGLLLLRLFIGFRLLYGVIDNVLSWERMAEFAGFLQSQGFPVPVLSAVISVYAQFVAGACLVIGFKVRIAAIMMVFNFLVAYFMVHFQDSVEGMTPALAMLFGSACLFFTGAGKWSIDKA